MDDGNGQLNFEVLAGDRIGKHVPESEPLRRPT